LAWRCLGEIYIHCATTLAHAPPFHTPRDDFPVTHSPSLASLDLPHQRPTGTSLTKPLPTRASTGSAQHAPPYPPDSHLPKTCSRPACHPTHNHISSVHCPCTSPCICPLPSHPAQVHVDCIRTSHLANLRSISPLRSACSLLSSFSERRTTRAATAR